jgi:uncharacterized membrane protein YphA (DoxX/SURF4 family)
MNNVISIQTVSRRTSGRRQVVASVALWAAQVILAILFLFAGSMKLITPIEVMMAQMSLPLPGWFVQFIGVAECAGALGLILPGLTRIQRRLTPLAASGLVIIMVGATVTTLLSGGGAGALFPLVVGLIAASVAYGRRSYALAS